MAIIKQVKGQRVVLSPKQIKAETMKNFGFKTTEEYNKYYDIRRNKRRAFEKFMALEGQPVEKANISEMLYKEGLARKRYGAEYQPSIEKQKELQFKSYSSGKAGTKALTSKRGREHAQAIIQNATYRQFRGLIEKNPTAMKIFQKYADNPVLQLNALITFANTMHAEIDRKGNGEAIYSGEVYGSSDYEGNFDV